MSSINVNEHPLPFDAERNKNDSHFPVVSFLVATHVYLVYIYLQLLCFSWPYLYRLFYTVDDNVSSLAFIVRLASEERSIGTLVPAPHSINCR